jgi:hypothetical protein
MQIENVQNLITTFSTIKMVVVSFSEMNPHFLIAIIFILTQFITNFLKY